MYKCYNYHTNYCLIFKEIGTTISVIQKYLSVGGASLAYDTDIQVLSNALKDLSVTQRAAVLSTTELSAAEQAQVLAASGATDQEIAHALATNGLTSAKKIETVAEFENVTATLSGNAAISEAIIKTLGLSVAEDGRLVGLEALTAEEVIAAATQNGMNAAQATALATTLGLQKSTIGLAASFKGLSASIAMAGNALTSIVAAHPVLLAMVVTIGTISAAIIHHKKAMESLNSTLETAKAHLKEQNENTTEEIKTLNDLIATYQELGQKASLTTEERNSLIDIQNQLAETYNVEERKIDVVNGKYEEQIELLKGLSKEKAEARIKDSIDLRTQNKNDIDEKFAVKDIHFGGVGDYSSDYKKKGAKRYALAYDKDSYTAYYESQRWFSDMDKQTKLAVKKTEKVLSDFHDKINDNPDEYGVLSAWGAKGRKQVLFKEEDLSYVLKYYQDAWDYLRDNLSYEEWNNDYYIALSEYFRTQIDAIETAINEDNELLQGIVQDIVATFSVNINDETINYENLTTQNALAWKSALINEFAKDDPELRQAIEDYYHYNLIPEISRRNKEVEETVEPIDLATWLNSDELSDVEKILGKIQTAYKNLAEGGTGFELDDDVLKQFPELAQYLDDADKLKEKLQEVANTKIQPLLDQLIQLRNTLSIDSEEYKTVQNTILWLQKQADVTNKVKEEKEKATKVSDLYKDQKLQIHENITALEREVKTIDKQISALEKKKDLQEKYIKTLEKEKDRLEDLIDDYETAASTVKDFIDEQNDALEKQKDNIEDTYKAQIKAIEETYDKQVKLLEAQEEGFDKQIKALQDEADEQDRLNDLKEKELALEKAKNEKVRVYSAEKGWQVVQNSEAIAAARKELEETQRENKIVELEKEKERLESEKERLQAEKEQRVSELETIRDKEIEALQAEMDKLKEYKKAWEEAIAAYKKAQDEMTTAAILGADWRTKLAEQDKTIIEDYKNGYEGVQNQLNNSVIPMIELANKELDTYSEQIDKLKEQKDLYKDMEDNQKKYLDFYKTYAEQFADATKEQSDAVEALNKALATNTLLTNMDDTDKFWDLAKSLFDEDYIREYPDFKGGGSSSSGLIGKLADIYNKSTSVYDSFIKSMPNLLNKTSSDLSGQIIAGAKMIADSVTNNKSNVDNSTHTVNINNPGFAMTLAEFTPLLTAAVAQIYQESQIGKK